MRSGSGLWLTLLVLTGSLVGESTLLAQSNEELNGALQFNFHTPGARSLGIGRAFTARADDATAAYANPAGLLWLTEPEVSLEGRTTSFTTVHIDGGRANGVPTNFGIDRLDGPTYSETERDTTGVAFSSVVYPVSRRWRLALYRHELANLEAAIDRSEGIFFTLPRERPDRTNQGRVTPVQAEMELNLTHLGLSAAYELTDEVWAGFGLSSYSFELRSVWEGFSNQPSAPDEPSFDPAVFSPSTSGGTRIHRGNDEEVGLVAGLLWRLPPDDRWTAGLVYRQGPKFDFSVERYRRTAGDPPCGQLSNPPVVPCGALEAPARNGVFDVPDVFSVGVSFQPTPISEEGPKLSPPPMGSSEPSPPPWIFSFEYDLVKYSDLAPSINVLTIAESEGIDLAEFDIDDGEEFHLGVERRLATKRRLAGKPCRVHLRLGSWVDPAHQHRWSDRPPLSTTNADGVVKPTNDAVRLAVRFPGGDDELHFTGGAGITFGRYRLDAAADFSDRGDVISLTGVIQFPRRAHP